MKRAQKLILMLFALVDLAVIGGLAFVVIRSSSQSVPELSPGVSPPPACVTGLMEAFSTTADSARVAWSEDAGAPTEMTLHLTFALPPGSEPPTPQFIWTVLDQLPSSLLEDCPLPSTLTVAVATTGDGGTHHYAVAASGELLAGWVRGDISDAELAEHARYRESHNLAP